MREDFSALLRSGTASAAVLGVLSLPLQVLRHGAQAAISKQQPAPGLREVLKAAAVPKSGLFRGLVPALCHSSLSPLVFLLGYEVQRGSTEVIQAGMVAKAVQVTALQPFDLIRTCRQAVILLPSSAAAHLQRTPWEVVMSEGTRSLWRGWIPTLLRDVLAAGLFWHSYTLLTKSILKEPWEEEFDRKAMQQRAMTCAAISGVCAAGSALVTQPFDVVKTRMQIHCMVTSDAKSGYRYFKVARVGKTFRETMAMAGWRGPLFEYAELLSNDADRPLRHPLILGEDPGRTIVHPRSTRDMFIEVKTG